jgi:hypothetical protein
MTDAEMAAIWRKRLRVVRMRGAPDTTPLDDDQASMPRAPGLSVALIHPNAGSTD